MSIYVDKRPWTRGMRLGWQTLKTIFDNFFTLITKINVEHNAESGEHRTRKVAIASGTYVYNSGTTVWDLVGGVGPLPTSSTRPGTGQCKLTWTSSMGSTSKYDVVVMCKTKSGTEIINWSWTGKTATEITIVMREQGAPGALYDGDFSVIVHKEP
jgi:hypothetical protein